MAGLIGDLWNYIPQEILSHIFSFLPLGDRFSALHVCKSWAAAVTSTHIWNFAEISCDVEYLEAKRMMQRLEPFLGLIRHLKLVFNQALEYNRRHVTDILKTLALQNSRLQGLSIVCRGKSPYYYSGQDILKSIKSICQNESKVDLQYIDFQQMPFTLGNGMVKQIASNSPNLHTLLLNNHAPGIIILKPETIVEILRVCPKLSTLGLYYASLSSNLFWELAKPTRGPFRLLDIYCEGLDNHISEELWALVRNKHPGLRVKLEFSHTVATRRMPPILNPSIPIVSLRFNTFTHMADQVELVSANYSRTLETLILQPVPSNDLNAALVRLAKRCTCLKEVHCYCVVNQAVVDAFLLHCPHLTRYTLPTARCFCDSP